MTKKTVLGLVACGLISMAGSVAAQQAASNVRFDLKFGPAGIASLKCLGDAFDTDYIAQGATLGDALVRFRIGGGRWHEASTQSMTYDGRRRTSDAENHPPRYQVTYHISDRYGWGDDLEFTERFMVEGESLIWTLNFRNLTDEPIEIGDIVLPLPFNTRKGWNRIETETLRVLSHSLIAGHGSFLFWMRPNSVGPYLVMVPLLRCPSSVSPDSFAATKLEYVGGGRPGFDGADSVFIHSAFSGQAEKEGARVAGWRQPHTSVTLTPMSMPGSEVTYGFKFHWANDYDGVRDVLYEEGLIDVQIVPGMTVPEDLVAGLSLRTKNVIKTVTPEFPDQTKIEDQGQKGKDTHIYKVEFSRRGENLLTVNFGEGLKMGLEFFVTEPLETLIKKRAAFLATRQVIRDPTKWYDGLVADWDMKNERLVTPDTPGQEENYNLTMGDPMLCKAPYIASKNAHFPEQKEVEAEDYHLKNFVWGKLQLTDKEGPLPYGIYGLPNWKVNRESRGTAKAGSWTEQLSRAYDYPHYIALYFGMYRTAKNSPELKMALTKEEYLERAFGTARAYFNLPYQRNPLEHNFWFNKASAQTTGMYNEVVIVDLIDELYGNGKTEEADLLRGEWEKKVRYFVKEDPYLWGSEFAFDPTAFESTHALSKYAMEHAFKPGSRLDLSRDEVISFMEREIQANIATRGWLETAYYLLGGERSLRYMAQMGGWSILDYALYYAKDPMKYLRLGYASYLSSWALMNTGTPDSNYGFWYPGPENDGSTGGTFTLLPRGRFGLDGRQSQRGAQPLGGEIDLGYTGALRTSATIVADDPLFGLFAYGGRLTRTAKGVEVIPRDGLRERFHVLRGKRRLHMLLDRDGYAKDKPIIFTDSLDEIRFSLENRGGGKHGTSLKISGLPAGAYQLLVNGKPISTIRVTEADESVIVLPMERESGCNVAMIKLKI